MAHQVKSHAYIYKLHSNRLAEAKWDLTLPLTEAMDNQTDIVSLSDSQLLRFIDQYRGIDSELRMRQLKDEIAHLKSRPDRNGFTNKKIKELYLEMYKTQFKADYVCVVMDTLKHYDRCNKGFYINGIKYRRFLGTTNGIKKSTIIYLSEEIYPWIKERLDCGRDTAKPIVPAKLEAYQALICSGSIVVSMPKGIIVVDDVYTKYKADVIYIDDTGATEPVVTEVKDKEIESDASDGFGFMLPDLAKRWSGELNNKPEEYLSGVNTRGLPWTKGMLFPFDFIRFAEEVAHSYMIQDAWGDWRDVREAEVILTTSMLKLWDSYPSWEAYWQNLMKYGYRFAVSKTAPYELEEEHCTNYQFLQSYELTDEEIHKLVAPTIRHIKEVVGLDPRKAVLYMKGKSINPNSVLWRSAGVAEALMIEPKLIKDPYVRSAIRDSLKVRIKRAKTGVLDVPGNFAIIGGDLYSLAQHMFGLPVTGLLKAGQIWHKFWLDKGVNEVCMFRAPMTSHNNIRRQQIATPDNSPNFSEMERWYKYIETCVILNSWDTTSEALNGADFDGDLCFTTNDEVLLKNTKNLPAIFCIEKKATKIIPTEDDIIKANKLSFGDEIGSTTNVITSQICALSKFDPGSTEYKELYKRILCGQFYQQGCIDKAKGIISPPMPKYWYVTKTIVDRGDEAPEEQARHEFFRRICVDKKPYFFIYNYDHLYTRYRKFIEQRDNSALREYGLSYEELLVKEDKTPDQEVFLSYCDKMNPVDSAPCVVNKLCWIIEDETKDLSLDAKRIEPEFSPEILKSKHPSYTSYQYYEARQVLITEYESYKNGLKKLLSQLIKEGIHGQEKTRIVKDFTETFETKARIICPDSVLRTDILIDIAYKSNDSKKFVWETCGGQIIRNLLAKKDGRFFFPVRVDIDDEECFSYHGEFFKPVEYTIPQNEYERQDVDE